MDGRSFYPFLIKFSKRRAGSPKTYLDHFSQPGSRGQGGAFPYSPLYGVPPLTPTRDAEIKRATIIDHHLLLRHNKRVMTM